MIGKGPVFIDEIGQGEWNCYRAEKKIRKGKHHDEDIASRQQNLNKHLILEHKNENLGSFFNVK